MSMLETKNRTAQVQTDGDSSIDLYPEPAENCLVKEVHSLSFPELEKAISQTFTVM